MACNITNIFESNCLLVIQDADDNVLAEFNLAEVRIVYGANTFKIKDKDNHIVISIDDLPNINLGIYSTFADLYNFIETERATCICACGGGGGHSAVWGSITGTLEDQTDLQTALNNKQDISLNAYTFRANNTSSNANATNQVFKDIAEQTYTGSIAWTGTTAPSGTTTHSYRWSQVGKLVTLRLTLIYANTGSALTSVVCSLPTDCPTPEAISGSTANGSALYVGSGTLATAILGDGMSPSVNGGISELKINSAGTGYEIKIYRGSAGYRTARAFIQYYAS